MRKLAAVSLATVVLLLVAAGPARAWRQGRPGHHHHGVRTRVIIGVGPAWWWGPPAPFWWYYPPPYHVYGPPLVIVEQPTLYIQQQPTVAPAAPAYWYYCPSAKAYYPHTPTCPEAWIKVPPRTE